MLKMFWSEHTMIKKLFTLYMVQAPLSRPTEC